MKKKNAKRGELDLQSIKQIIISAAGMFGGAYAMDPNAFNTIIQGRFSPTISMAVIAVVGYAAKKMMTDYSSSNQ